MQSVDLESALLCVDQRGKGAATISKHGVSENGSYELGPASAGTSPSLAIG